MGSLRTDLDRPGQGLDRLLPTERPHRSLHQESSVLSRLDFYEYVVGSEVPPHCFAAIWIESHALGDAFSTKFALHFGVYPASRFSGKQVVAILHGARQALDIEFALAWG